MSAYDEAVAELYQAPHGAFVDERKRLAATLKAAGDKAAAGKLGKLGRPTISAWAVNQLWWHARDAFDGLLETAALLREGDLRATTAYREAIAKLRARATRILGDAGHGATEGTLRKVTQSLAALAASGRWDPDPPGALAADRDPPGFEAIGIAPSGEDANHEPAPASRVATMHDELAELRTRKAAAEAEADELAELRTRKAAAEAEATAAERTRIEAERARIKAETHRLETALRATKAEIAAAERVVHKLREQLAHAEDNVAQAQAVADDLQTTLDELDA